jgi:UDP-galactose transporter B1
VKTDDGSSGLGLGEIWILASLALDGVVASCQEFMKRKYQTPKSNMMLNMNLYALLVLGGRTLYEGSIGEFIEFVQRHPSTIQWLAALGICSALGQMFIFSIVTTFGPLWCSIVTTTRKFFTILFSVLYFGNSLTPQQWAGSILVFIGLSCDSWMSIASTSNSKNEKLKKKDK